MRPTNDAIISPLNHSIDVESWETPTDLEFAIEKFWKLRWDLDTHRAEIVADLATNVVLEGPWSRIVGVTTRVFSRTLFGKGDFISAKFRPGAFRYFVDRSPANFIDGQVSLFEFKPNVERLTEIQRTGSFALYADYFRDELRPPHDTIQKAIDICEAIANDPLLRTVDAVCDRFDCSPRTLQRLMSEHVGLSAKWMIMRYRLRDAVSELKLEERSISAVALRLGYFDQAHFTKDFKATTGRTPTSLLREWSTRSD